MAHLQFPGLNQRFHGFTQIEESQQVADRRSGTTDSLRGSFVG